MRILILTQYFEPEPVPRCGDLARGLRALGHEVQVITGFPCFPFGNTYAGFRQRLFAEHTIEGTLVTRVPQFPDHSRSAIGRALYYLSFALSAATIGLWRARPADAIVVYQSAFPVGLAARFISFLKRTPYLLDVIDLWPESVAASGMLKARLPLAIIRHLVRFIYRGAAHVNVITGGYRDHVLAAGVRPEHISLIHCWHSGDDKPATVANSELAEQHDLKNRFNIMYAGAMGPVQDLRTVVDAAGLLGDLPQVQFVLIGDGVEQRRLAEYAAARGVANVRFIGRMPARDVESLFPFAEALLVRLKADSLSSVSIPSKTFTYLAAGRPIVMAVAGESARLISKHQCGLTVAPSDPHALAAAVRTLVDLTPAERNTMGAAARAAYTANYQSDRQIARFATLLESVVARTSAEPRSLPRQLKSRTAA